MKRIVLLTNEMTPYRKSFYDILYNEFKTRGVEFKVLTMTKLQKGYSWNFNDVMAEYVHLMKGIHLSIPINIHINTEVVSCLKTIKPDILIMAGSYVNPTSWMAMWALRNSNCRTYFWSESHLNEVREYSAFKIKFRNAIRRRFYSLFSGFWYAGKLSREFVEAFCPPNKELIFVPNLIDNKLYNTRVNFFRKSIDALRAKWNIDEGKKVAIIPARLSKEKGIIQFLDIIEICKNKDKLTVLIPGTGPLKDKIEETIKQKGVDVRLFGYQQQSEIIELYGISDFFIMPSLSDPNPLTCVEALWCGLPLLISSHVGNYPEVVHEGINGYVFKYSDMEAASSNLDQLITNNQDWYNIASKESLSIAESIYNPETAVKNIINSISQWL